MYRLAIAEAPADIELGEILDVNGRQPNRRALVEIVRRGQAAGFVGPGEPERLGQEFFALLMGDLMVWLLLGVSAPPTAGEISERAERATRTLLTLHPA